MYVENKVRPGRERSLEPSVQRSPVLIPRRKAPACIAKKRVERAAAGSRRLLLIMPKKCRSSQRGEDAKRRQQERFWGVSCGTPTLQNVLIGGAKHAILFSCRAFVREVLVPPTSRLPGTSLQPTEPTTPVYAGTATAYSCTNNNAMR